MFKTRQKLRSVVCFYYLLYNYYYFPMHMVTFAFQQDTLVREERAQVVPIATAELHEHFLSNIRRGRGGHWVGPSIANIKVVLMLNFFGKDFWESCLGGGGTFWPLKTQNVKFSRVVGIFSCSGGGGYTSPWIQHCHSFLIYMIWLKEFFWLLRRKIWHYFFEINFFC